MLRKKIDGLYVSSLLGSNVIHGFTGRKLRDMRDNAANRVRFFDSLNIAPWKLCTVHQIHSNIIATVDSMLETENIDADGLVYKPRQGQKDKTIVLGVFAADCVPVLLADIHSGVIAAVHAGWRGTLLRIVERAVEKMCALGASPPAITAVLGPHIGMCCYTVGDDVAKKFQDAFSGSTMWLSGGEGQWHLSLAGIVSRQLASAGINTMKIDAHPVCTSCRRDEFFSYRRDTKDSYGEMVAFIAFGKS